MYVVAIRVLSKGRPTANNEKEKKEKEVLRLWMNRGYVL